MLPTAAVTIRDVIVRYGPVAALDGVDLEIERGAFVSLLGPSGCGKTTLLNVIAGFVTADNGTVLIEGEDVSSLPPHRRALGMVFQSYALFPHMDVFSNVAYGLRVRRVPRSEIARRVSEELELVGLGGFEKRRPRQLSGGQQQRVALARALVVRPRVLLMDEPLSNLDAKLRREMRLELRALLSKTGITTLFVTHDQEEALVLSDRIAVMNRGRIEQIGAPADLYRRPGSRFVAEFIGEASLFAAKAKGAIEGDTSTAFETSIGVLHATVTTPIPDGQAVLAIRPEHVRVGSAPLQADNVVSGTLEQLVFKGDAWQCIIRLASGDRLAAHVVSSEGDALREGQSINAAWSASDTIALTIATT